MTDDRPAAATTSDHVARALADDLARWSAPDEQTEAVRAGCASLLARRGGAALVRDGGPEHVTASCVVLSPDLRSVLLTLHRKIGLWLQLGGHLEAGDCSAPQAARREAREESGIEGLEIVGDLPIDIEWQDVSRALACTVHWDLGYVALVDPCAPVAVSAESHQLQWWPVDDLPDPVPATLALRVARAARAVRASGAGPRGA